MHWLEYPHAVPEHEQRQLSAPGRGHTRQPRLLEKLEEGPPAVGRWSGVQTAALAVEGRVGEQPPDDQGTGARKTATEEVPEGLPADLKSGTGATVVGDAL